MMSDTQNSEGCEEDHYTQRSFHAERWHSEWRSCEEDHYTQRDDSHNGEDYEEDHYTQRGHTQKAVRKIISRKRTGMRECSLTYCFGTSARDIVLWSTVLELVRGILRKHVSAEQRRFLQPEYSDYTKLNWLEMQDAVGWSFWTKITTTTNHHDTNIVHVFIQPHPPAAAVPSTHPQTVNPHPASGESSAVWAPDSWSKGCEFESPQERWENYLLQGELSVLTLI